MMPSELYDLTVKQSENWRKTRAFPEFDWYIAAKEAGFTFIRFVDPAYGTPPLLRARTEIGGRKLYITIILAPFALPQWIKDLKPNFQRSKRG